MDRTHETWLKHLRSTGPDQEEAITDLRRTLIAGLRKAFQGRTGVDDAFFEDVAQQTLVKTLESLDQFKGKSRFTTWATAIAVRVALTDLRRQHWKGVSLEQAIEGSGRAHDRTVDPGADPQQNAQHKALIGKMYQIINTQLTEKQRDALLAELNGLPQEEIGRRMGTNRNAVYKLTHDARKRLKQHLEAAGYTAADLQTGFGR